MWNSDDLSKLVSSLRDLPLTGQQPADRPWRRTPAARVVDCVLSINRRYDRFVVPKVKSFVENYPNVCSITDLRDLVRNFSSAEEFFVKVLNYNHKDRARILEEVVNYLVDISGKGSCDEQSGRLKQWAKSAHPSDYNRLNVRGFALASFQYLRMHFGADTAKPDVHICRFVEEAIGRHVSAAAALDLFERASKELGVSARELDTTIWRLRARESD